MGYEYITDNNLEDRQQYNYTQFRGVGFLDEYFQNRQTAIGTLVLAEDPKMILSVYIKENTSEDEDKESDIIILKILLIQLLAVLLSDERLSALERGKLDKVVKTFEVRKRLYQKYNTAFKPADENDYHELELYLLTALVMAFAYQCFNDLKYLNALLKLNDTLISIKNDLISQENKSLPDMFLISLNMELSFIGDLMDRKSIRRGAQ